jgi:hypothetical protein
VAKSANLLAKKNVSSWYIPCYIYGMVYTMLFVTLCTMVYLLAYTMWYIIGAMVYTIKSWYIVWGNIPDGVLLLAEIRVYHGAN